MSNSIVIYGKHSVFGALDNKNRDNKKIYISQDINPKVLDILTKHNIKIETKSNKELDSLTNNGVHQGVALLTSSVFLEDFNKNYFKTSQDKSCILILDQVTDPQNIGSIIRSAASFGIDALILQKDNSPKETGSMTKAAAGGMEVLKILKVNNISQAISALKDSGYWIIGLDGDTGQEIHNLSLPNKTVFVLGSEGKGMRHLVKSNCDLIAKIPISKKIESLNVSIAASIAMYHYAITTSS